MYLILPLLLAAADPQALPPAPLAPPSAEPSPAEPPIDYLAFEQHDERMTVPVSLGADGPYEFIIDTGAQRTVISRELADELKLAAGPRVRLTAMTGTTHVGTVVVPRLSVSTVSATRIEAPALERRNLGARGILGIDTLQGHAVAIDFDKQRMEVVPSTKRKGRSAPGEIVVRAKSLFGQLVVTDATFRGSRIRVVLDTGSAVSMGNEPLRRLVRRAHGKPTPVELLSVIGDKMTAGYTQIPQVKIGAVMFENLPVAFSVTAPFKQFGLEDRPAILLGMDALKLFRRVQIDFANREVRLVMPRA
jgi:predicted aspartyl protease